MNALQNNVPLVSVLIIARKKEECDEITAHLSRQSLNDFEVITEVGGTIPQAWNRALARAKGHFIVFTETDARPLDERWLEQLVASMDDEKTVIKGLEVNHSPWNLCNTIMKREALIERGFDESFLCAEDTELLSYLRCRGYRLEKRAIAPVIHAVRADSPKAVRRAFRYGINWMRIRHRYVDAVEPVPFDWLIRRLLIVILQTLGMFVGWAYSFKERRLRAREIGQSIND